MSIMGRILCVNLSDGKISIQKLDAGTIEVFIGGFGICVKLACDMIKPEIESLSPLNPLIIGAGALVGTNVPAACRVYVFTRLPVNGAIGWGGGGGSFGPHLKLAGYDGVIIQGKAEKPVFVIIEDDNVEINSAEHLWGLGIGKTCEEIWKECGDGGILAIGQAGERLVRFSMAYIDKFSTVGRGGIGAVFGLKNLKALFVRGSGSIEVKDNERYNRIVEELIERMRSYPYIEEWQELGLLKSLPVIPKDIYLRLRKRRVACISCPIGDKDLINLDGEEIYTTSIVNLMTPITMGMKNYKDAIRLTATLDEYGLDMYEFFGVLSYAKELSERGIIKIEEEIDFTSYNSMLSWARRIAFREGLGSLLAEGFAAMERKFGVKAKSVIKGMRAYVTPKGPLIWNLFGTMELSQILDPRGPHVGAGGSPTYFAKRPLESFRKHLVRMGVPESKIDEILGNGIKIGKLLCYSHIWFTVLASLGICARAQINRFYSAEICAKLYSAATGIEVDKEKLIEKAREIWKTLKLANFKAGFTRDYDTPPNDWFDDGFKNYVTGDQISREYVEREMDDYYNEMGLKEFLK